MQDYYVDSPQQLEELCARLHGIKWIALDSEFMREKTYYAQLCLLQIATDKIIACIDPLALADMTPLLDIIYDSSITKVLHSSRQDLEIFYDLRGDLPRPVFDTQVAAALLGYGDQVGYSALVNGMLGVQLDKSQTRTDWSTRPLSVEQLQYAADDVRYLGKIYSDQYAELEQRGRLTWLDADFAELVDVTPYLNAPDEAWRRVRQANTLKGAQLAVLRALAAWREQRARASNRPRKWIISDDALLELARRMPGNADALAKIRGLEASTLKHHGVELSGIVQGAKSLAQGEWPLLESPHRLTSAQEALADALMATVRLRGAQGAISTASLVTRKELERLVLGERDLPILHGWRGALVGQDLLALLQGERALRVQEGSLKITQESQS
ncbi:MAG: ribonuclease D [Gammaproteobacteria bacterium]|nr:ribonuclease D [Gammaproteobacteria bacterium]